MSVHAGIGVVAVAGLVILGTAGCAGSQAREVAGGATGHGMVVVAAARPAGAVPDVEPTTCDAGALPKPAWAPPIVSAVTVECPGAIAGAAGGRAVGASTLATSHVATVITYSLSGAANQETLRPASAMTAAGIDSGSYHPASEIDLIVYPDPGGIDRGVSGAGISVSNVQLANGFTALVTQGSNGYGVVRVAWSDGRRSYLLMTTVMKTDAGTSGATATDMIKMAGSVPASS